MWKFTADDVPAPAYVVDRQVFYNNRAFDSGLTVNLAHGVIGDDAAIAARHGATFQPY